MILSSADITVKAYDELLSIKCGTLPITENHDFFHNDKKIVITSIQSYALMTGVTEAELTLGGKFDEGLCITGIHPEFDLILYNRNKIRCRKRFTVMHEIGHLKCGHEKHGKQEELEAHFFASQLLVPDILLYELHKRGYAITGTFISKTFDISGEASEKKAHSFSPPKNKASSKQETLILKQFEKYLDENFPEILS